MELQIHDDRALLALQGPAAAAVLQPLVDLDLNGLFFSGFVKHNIDGVPSYITRTGCARRRLPVLVEQLCAACSCSHILATYIHCSAPAHLHMWSFDTPKLVL